MDVGTTRDAMEGSDCSLNLAREQEWFLASQMSETESGRVTGFEDVLDESYADRKD